MTRMDGANRDPWPPINPNQPPVTADHTPERLSAEERRVLSEAVKGHSHPLSVERPLFATVEAIHAAHLADVEARLAAAGSALERTEGNLLLAINGRPVRDLAENLAENRAALHPDPSDRA